MKIIVLPSSFEGEIWANPSKSIMQRALALASISTGEVHIANPGYCEDSLAAIGIAEALGAEIIKDEDFMIVRPSGQLKSTVWNAGESGLSARLFAPVAGLYEEDITITGRGTLLKRPMNTVIEALQQLGLEVQHNDYHLPLTIKGTISKFELDLDLSSGSQLLTGLLIALSKASKDSRIKVSNLKSKPYVDMTICAAKGFGAVIDHEDYRHFTVKAVKDLQRRYFNIEGDWSGAAFHLVGGAISGKVVITGINPRSKQGDKAILEALMAAGAKVKTKHNKVIVEKSELNAFEFDATDSPDLFPPLAVLAAYCKGTSKIKGISRLKYKESDRYETLKSEFAKTGINISKKDDFMLVEGGLVNGASIDTHNDHRIAMAMATLGLQAQDDIVINGVECVNKSYPDYFLDYEILGGVIQKS